MSVRCAVPLIALAVCLMHAECSAQSMFNSGSGGSSGGRGGSAGSGGGMNTGSTMNRGGATGAANRTAGRGSQFGSGNNRAGPTAGGGRQGGMQQGQAGANGSLAASLGTPDFVGQGNAQDGSFLGVRNTGQRGAAGMRSQFSGLQGLGNRGGSTGGFNNGGFGGRNMQQTQTQLPLRPQMQLGFDAVTLTPTNVQNTVQQRLARLPAGIQAGNVVSQMDADGILTLSGRVRSEDDRLLLETLVRMEPGVTGVRNELQIDR